MVAVTAAPGPLGSAARADDHAPTKIIIAAPQQTARARAKISP